MEKVVSNKNESVRLFKNPVLEFFSHIHPATPFVFFLPFVFYCLYRGWEMCSLMTISLSVLGGLLFWTLFEYVAHRFLFHFEASSALGKRIVFLTHGIHHAYPRDGTRLVMPLLVSVPLALFFYFLFWALFPVHHFPLFAGFILGYLTYDFMHYAIHHLPMKGKILEEIRAHHYRHHYQDATKGFGVSNPLWDFAFRTMSLQSRKTSSGLSVPVLDK